MGKVLVIDDDEELLDEIQQALSEYHEVTTGRSIEEAHAHLRTREFDAVISDLYLPDVFTRGGSGGRTDGGWFVLAKAQERYPSIPKIAISMAVPPDDASLLAKMSDAKFLVKEGPLWIDDLVDLTNRLVREREEERYRSLVFSDDAIRRQLQRLVDYETRHPDETPVPILLIGETGTGKGYWADQLFKMRANAGISKHFKNINCAALREGNALMVQLFGALPGYYSGTEDVPGILELMGGHWMIFLDEISKANRVAQGALLKLIDERESQRFPFVDIFKIPSPVAPSKRSASKKARPDNEIAEYMKSLEDEVKEMFKDAPPRYRKGWAYNKPIEFKGRIVAATHPDIVDQVREGRFLPDLYNRLRCFAVTIPPLRERGPDYIREKATDFVRERGVQGGIEGGALQKLAKHEWLTGNHRELEFTLMAAIMRADPDGPIESKHIEFAEAPWPKGKRLRGIFGWCSAKLGSELTMRPTALPGSLR